MGGSKMKIVSEREEMIQVDAYILFQRVTVIATHGKTDMEPIFGNELCPYPASLAQQTHTSLISQKSSKIFKIFL